MTRFELVTSSLPRKRSTPELHRQKIWAGDRVRTGDIQLGRLTLYQLSYSRLNCGESRIRTCEVKNSRFTVCPRWPLEYLPDILKNNEPMEGLEPTTCWLQISCSSQLSYIGFSNLWMANVLIYFFWIKRK